MTKNEIYLNYKNKKAHNHPWAEIKKQRLQEMPIIN